jgi:hypothetical protein
MPAISLSMGSMTKGQAACLLFIAAMILLFGIFYVININSLSQKGYQMIEANNGVGALTEQNQQLKIQLAQLQASDHLKQLSGELNMQEITKVQYAFFGQLPVAKR